MEFILNIMHDTIQGSLKPADCSSILMVFNFAKTLHNNDFKKSAENGVI